MDVYEAIYNRRDIRKFRETPVEEATLTKILTAAHHAGSVGFMQPWNFVVIRSAETRQRIHHSFQNENAKAAQNYTGEQRELYDSLKLEGILESPVNIAITCDRERGGKHVLGRNSISETDLFSTCCAVQNLWLAARAEEIGVGWVSIIDAAEVKKILQIPSRIELVAYLCLGYPVEFPPRPTLEEAGWRNRVPMDQVVMQETWNAASVSES